LKFTGIILAGGKSSRMGENKALLLYKGKPLITHLFEMFSGFCNEIIISTNTPEEYPFLNARKQTDFYKNIGPAAGFHAALKASCNEVNFVCSCDTPLLTKELFLFLYEKGKDFEAVNPIHNQISEPLIGVIQKKLYRDFENEIEKNNFSPSLILKQKKYLLVEINELQKFYHPDLFFNINTKNEFYILQKKII